MEIKKLALGGALALGASFVLVSSASAAAPDGASGPYADSVVSLVQGLRNDGTPVLPGRSDSTQALGAPESTGTPEDDPSLEGKFLSLGHGGVVVLKFDNGIENKNGTDLKVFEVTFPNYPDELLKVEVSPDGITWTGVGSVNRDGEVDFGDKRILPCAQYVRLTDISDPNNFPIPSDGYDLDAVNALKSNKKGCKPPKEDCKDKYGKKCACGPGRLEVEVKHGENTSTTTTGGGNGVIITRVTQTNS